LKFYPPINSRTTDELICIAHFPEEWNPVAVEQAKAELLKRNVPLDEQKKRATEIENTVNELNRLEFEQRQFESFVIIDLIFMALKWPYTMLSDWYLKKEGYYLLHKQRLYSIGAGIIFWICFFFWMNWTFEQEDIERQNAINREDVYEWELNNFSESELKEIRLKEIDEIFNTVQTSEHPSIIILNQDTFDVNQLAKLRELEPLSIRNIFIERLQEPHKHNRIEIVTIN
jgi:hypothetical protein